MALSPGKSGLPGPATIAIMGPCGVQTMTQKNPLGAALSAVLMAVVFLFFVPCLAGKGTSPAGVTFTLENGLKVLGRPVPSASSVALVVLFDIGEYQDPAGASGLAHLVDHLYLTAASGPWKSRPFEEFISRYPLGWNAQTGSGYTALATVFAPENLEAELAEAASRLKEVRVTATDLAREKPRVMAELYNMDAGIPVLAGLNRGREMVRPSPRGGRKGGLESEVAAITLAQVQDRLSTYYKPANATLALAGAFDGQKAQALINRLFGNIPSGRKSPRIPPPQKPGQSADEYLELRINTARSASLAFLVFAAPLPQDPLYPAFLLLTARLSQSAWRSKGGPITLHFAPLDDPEVLGISAALRPGESGKAVVGRLRAFLRESLDDAQKPADVLVAKNIFGLLLGFPGIPDAAFSQNTYGLAFSLARRHQLEIDGLRLAKAMENISAADFSAAARVFEDGRSAAVIVK